MTAAMDSVCDEVRGAGPIDDEAARVARFIDWLAAHGARLAGISIADCDGQRGVRAASALTEGAEVARIPQALFITSEAARASRVGQRLAVLSPDAPDRTHLALHLLALTREGGFWKPYLDLLPRDFSGHPLYYGPAELLMLEPRTAVGAMVKAVIEEWRSSAREVAKVLAEEGYTTEEFRWAYACVRSRAYDIGQAAAQELAMIPLADMLNHAIDFGTRGERPQGRDYVITAARGIAGGDEVTATYGQYGNVSLLTIYGFGLAENPYDGTMLTLDDRPHIIGRRYASKNVREMFGQLRLVADGHTARGLEREIQCLMKIHLACASALDRHVSALADDDPLCATIAPRSSLGRLHKALASEKAVLWHWMLLVTTAGRVLGTRGGEGQDMALLRYLDSDYADEVAALIARDRGERLAAAPATQAAREAA